MLVAIVKTHFVINAIYLNVDLKQRFSCALWRIKLNLKDDLNGYCNIFFLFLYSIYVCVSFIVTEYYYIKINE